MPLPSSRMTKNRPQPERYRPGKAEEEAPESEEESSEEEEASTNEAEEVAKAPPPKATSFPPRAKLAIDLSKAEQQVARQSKPSNDDLDGFVTASESSSAEEGNDDEGSEEESDSSEAESSSDQEVRRPMIAPKFISKAKRAQQGTSNTETSEADRAVEAERIRKQKADDLLQAQLERDAAARAAGKKHWDDEDIAPEDQVDDTDGIDPDTEQASWKLRELKRVRRDRLAIEEKEKEREEIERRRNMTAEERQAEDKAYIEAQKEEREGKGKMAYMQKYFHKGAFFGDAAEQDEEVRNALNRDFAGAKFEDETGDKGLLPEYMRIRDMTRLGKKGRTRYKDLQHEDTGRWGQDVGRKKRENNDLDERFRPDEQHGQERTGANSAPVGERRQREDDGYREREDKRPRRE